MKAKVIADILSGMYALGTSQQPQQTIYHNQNHTCTTLIYNFVTLCVKSHDSWAILLAGLTSASVSHSHCTEVMKRADEACAVAKKVFSC